jgi:DNA-binding Xre family transcriptional regulator
MAKKQAARQGQTIRRKATPEEHEHLRQAWAEEEAGMPANRELAREHRSERRRLSEAVAALKSMRQAQGITLTEMAERLGMPKGNLSRLENMDGPNPTIGTLERYASALGCRIEIAVIAN